MISTLQASKNVWFASILRFQNIGKLTDLWNTVNQVLHVLKLNLVLHT